MSAADDQRIAELFEAAARLAPNQRDLFLDTACRDDPRLKREVESLLEFDRRGFLEGSALELLMKGVSRDDEEETPEKGEPQSLALGPGVGSRIGSYRLKRVLGRGGMGVVFLGERDDGQFAQSVAIKILRADFPGHELARRFRIERQVLAKIQHPNIAMLLDGGVTEEGIQYFVMEYVDGSAIDEYSDSNRLTVDERLALFAKVCSAVEAAHKQLVLHRDLKPSNVLVTTSGEPKIVDFGIAKVLAATEGPTDHTGTSNPMTPQYASPEQARGESVTAASDVYSLGVMLYVLLAGNLPYTVSGLPLEEAVRVVCEYDPCPPSQAIGEGTSAAAIALARGAAPDQLRRRLKGALDRITLKAIRKTVTYRYPSAAALCADLGLVGEGLPAVSTGNVLRYRLHRVRKRRWLGVAAAALGLLAALWPDPAVQRYRRGMEAYAQGDVESARFLFESALRFDESFAMAHARLSMCFNALGMVEDSLRSASLAHEHRGEATRAEELFISAHYHLTRRDYAQALQVTREWTILDDSDAEAHRKLANTFEQLGELPEAIEAARQAMIVDGDDVVNRGLLMVLLTQAGRNDEALREYEAATSSGHSGHYLRWGEGLAWMGKGNYTRARESFEALTGGAGSFGFYETWGRMYLAQLAIVEGRFGEAEELLRDRRTETQTGLNYRRVARNEWLALLFLERGMRNDALRLAESLVDRRELPASLEGLRAAGLVYARAGAVGRAREVLELVESIRDAYPSLLSRAITALLAGEIAGASDRSDAARAYLEEANELLSDEYAADALAEHWLDRDDCARALPYLRDVLARKGTILRVSYSGFWVTSLSEAASCEAQLGRPDRARPLVSEFLQLWGAHDELEIVRGARGVEAQLAATR